VQDLESGREFYQRAFGLPVFHEDDSSTVFRFGDTLVNLLQEGEAPGLVAPAAMAPADSGVRFQLTVGVDDVDAVCAVLTARGVELLNEGHSAGDSGWSVKSLRIPSDPEDDVPRDRDDQGSR